MPDKVTPAVSDRQDFVSPACIQLTGWVGRRIAGNASARLVKIDPARHRVWLPLAGHPEAVGNLLLAGRASTSGTAVNEGNSAQEGIDAINHDNPRSIAIVASAAAKQSVWFVVSLPAPAPVRRIAFVQGPPGRSTGWFDAEAGRPLVEIQRQPGDRWESVDELAGYPATTAGDNAGLRRGQCFELCLPAPVPVAVLRVI